MASKPPDWCEVPRELTKTAQRVLRRVGRAVQDYAMIAEGDRVAVALSGGKDSFTLYWALEMLRRRAPIRFELAALHADMGYGDAPRAAVERFAARAGAALTVAAEDNRATIERLSAGESSPCSVCARLRRGMLYTRARRLGMTTLALGHHRTDLAATLLLNMVFTARIRSMPPALRSDDGGLLVVRPLAYADEADIAAFAAGMGFPVQPETCPHAASLAHGQRAEMVRLLAELDARHGYATAHVAAALGRVQPSHLSDRGLFDFSTLRATRRTRNGDDDGEP